MGDHCMSHFLNICSYTPSLTSLSITVVDFRDHETSLDEAWNRSTLCTV